MGRCGQKIVSYCLKIDAKFRDHLKKLKGANLSVFMIIALHMDTERRSFPGISRISALSGYDRKTVIKSIRALENLYLIERRKRYHKSAIYTIKGFIHPLFERGDIPLSNNSKGGKFPSSGDQSGKSSSELTPSEEDTNIYKKKLKGEKKSPSRGLSCNRKLSGEQLKDWEKERASLEEQQIAALSEAGQRLLEEKADALLPAILQGKRFFIKVKMRELLEDYSLDESKII